MEKEAGTMVGYPHKGEGFCSPLIVGRCPSLSMRSYIRMKGLPRATGTVWKRKRVPIRR